MTGHWRIRISCIVMLLLPLTVTGQTVQKTAPMRIGLAAVFLDESRVLLDQWSTYLSDKLGWPVEFVQRRTYAELTDELLKRNLQASWVCTYPYVVNREKMRLLVVPVYKGKPTYRSYLIVPAEDRKSQGIADLAGRIFAYTENQSLSGFVIPRYWIRESGGDPAHFFRTAFFTWSHRNSIIAVADGLADGAAVDGYIWESMRLDQPEIVSRTRVIRKSRAFGFPPLVTARDMDEQTFAELQQVLVEMDSDAVGRSILEQLNLDRFEIPSEELYQSAMKFVDAFRD